MERAELRKLVLDTGCALERDGFMFLYDPKGGEAERAQLENLVSKPEQKLPGDLGWLCIPTGGTSGGLRMARHDEKTLSAAVQGFCAHFRVKQINALDVLPAYHVSGLMARIRCAETRGKHLAWSWKQLEAGEWPALPATNDGWFLSLVPTQLQRLLANTDSVAKLRQFRVIFIGGGPLWPELAKKAAAALVPIVICYGMTETAAMVVAQREGDFLGGDRSCGSAMPHVTLELVDEVGGRISAASEAGLVRISGENLFRGYWPAAKTDRPFLTEDLGQIDHTGRLTLLGRRDSAIITGGKKVHATEVENVLLASGEFEDVAIIGVPDSDWGQAVVACYPVRRENLNTVKLEQALKILPAFKRPKRWIALPVWPRNAQGKLNRAALAKAVGDQPA